MKTIPVTPELLQILKNAHIDSLDTINDVESCIEQYTANAKRILICQLERRKQLNAVLLDLLNRYGD